MLFVEDDMDRRDIFQPQAVFVARAADRASSENNKQKLMSTFILGLLNFNSPSMYVGILRRTYPKLVIHQPEV